MDNPLVANRKYLLYYVLTWMLIMFIQAALLNMYFGVGFWISVTDSLVFNSSFAFLGLSSWFMVRFMQSSTTKLLYLFFNYLLVALLVSILWVSVCSYSLFKIFESDTQYQMVLENGVSGRLIAGFFFYLLIILFYYLVIYYHNIQEKLKTEVLLNEMVQEAKLDILKSQMNPHFIFNSLNSVSSLIITEPEKAREMVIKLASFLRYSLFQDSRTTSTVGEELSNIENYLDIEKIRFGDRLHYISSIGDRCLLCTLPSLILQPLFENAIKHGVYKSTGKININLTIKQVTDHLEIVLKNNFDPESGVATNSRGIGLKNIKNRLKLLYKRNDLFSVEKSHADFEVSLRIPQKPALTYEAKNVNNR